MAGQETVHVFGREVQRPSQGKRAKTEQTFANGDPVPEATPEYVTARIAEAVQLGEQGREENRKAVSTAYIEGQRALMQATSGFDDRYDPLRDSRSHIKGETSTVKINDKHYYLSGEIIRPETLPGGRKTKEGHIDVKLASEEDTPQQDDPRVYRFYYKNNGSHQGSKLADTWKLQVGNRVNPREAEYEVKDPQTRIEASRFLKRVTEGLRPTPPRATTVYYGTGTSES